MAPIVQTSAPRPFEGGLRHHLPLPTGCAASPRRLAASPTASGPGSAPRPSPSPPCRGNTRPPWSGNAQAPWCDTTASAIAACSRPIARQASPHSGLDTSSSCRSQSAASTSSGQSGSAGAGRGATVVPAALVRPGAASAPCPSPPVPVAPAADDERPGPPARYVACRQLPYPDQDQALVCR